MSFDVFMKVFQYYDEYKQWAEHQARSYCTQQEVRFRTCAERAFDGDAIFTTTMPHYLERVDKENMEKSNCCAALVKLRIKTSFAESAATEDTWASHDFDRARHQSRVEMEIAERSKTHAAVNQKKTVRASALSRRTQTSKQVSQPNIHTHTLPSRAMAVTMDSEVKGRHDRLIATITIGQTSTAGVGEAASQNDQFHDEGKDLERTSSAWIKSSTNPLFIVSDKIATTNNQLGAFGCHEERRRFPAWLRFKLPPRGS